MRRLYKLKEEKRARKAKNSFYEFLKYSFKKQNPKTKFEDSWHYEYICDLLQEEIERIDKGIDNNYDVIIINVPPRSLKSTIVAITLNAWMWINYPHISILSSSYSASLATSHTTSSRDLMLSDWYQNNYGDSFEFTGDMNTKTHFKNKHNGERYSTGVGGSATGMGGNVLIVDDPINPQRADSEIEREKVNKWWDETFYNRINNSKIGVRFIIQQRLHENDLTGHVLTKSKEDPENYRVLHICLPAYLTDDVSPKSLVDNYVDNLLMPDRFDHKELNKYKISLGPYGYAGQMLQSPIVRGGGIVKREWFNILQRSDLKTIPDNLIKYSYTDSSQGKATSDEIATGIWSIYKGRIIIWDMLSVRKRFEDFAGMKDPISGEWLNGVYDEFLVRNNCYTNEYYHFWEDKLNGEAYTRYINSQNPNISAIEDNPGTASKEARVYRAVPTIWSGRVWLVEGHWNESFLAQVEAFPNGSEDGMIDVLSSIVRKSVLSDIDEKAEQNTVGEAIDREETLEDIKSLTF